jgi:glycosyltransferase involved in cell wall biosynthesis
MMAQIRKYRKILVNGLLLTDHFSGVQYSIENLLLAVSKDRESQPDIDIEVLVPGRYSGGLTAGDRIAVKALRSDMSSRVKRIAYEHYGLPKYFSENGFDLYHSPAYVLPRFSNIPGIVTIHDLLPLDSPQYCQRESVAYFSLCLSRSVFRARKIIAVSHTVKADIVRKFDIDPDLVTVVYHGVEPLFKRVVSVERLTEVASKYRLPDKFILFVGNIEPKKNLSRLIRAFSYLKKHTGLEHKLVLAGKKGWKCLDIYKSVRDAGMEGEVLFTGYADRADLPALYSLADVFSFPSLYEGFGLPVLEAMACGTPVLISNRGALPEIAPGLYPQVNPFDEKDIASKLYELLTSAELREKNIRYGYETAKAFTWERSAKGTIDVYREVLSKIRS